MLCPVISWGEEELGSALRADSVTIPNKSVITDARSRTAKFVQILSPKLELDSGFLS